MVLELADEFYQVRIRGRGGRHLKAIPVPCSYQTGNTPGVEP